MKRNTHKLACDKELIMNKRDEQEYILYMYESIREYILYVLLCLQFIVDIDR